MTLLPPKRPRIELYVRGSIRRCLGMSSSTGADSAYARASIALDPADGPVFAGDDVELLVGYTLVNLVFRGEINEDSDDLAPHWVEISLTGQLKRASRRTNIVDPVASEIETGGVLGEPPEIPDGP